MFLVKSLEQETVNKKIDSICTDLKNIERIGNNYLEYFSALIFIMLENQEELESWSNIKSDEQEEYILKDIDSKVRKISYKVGNELFSNIKFESAIDKFNFENFIIILHKLSKLILKLNEKNYNAKELIAEAFEHQIEKSATFENSSLNDNEFFTPRSIVKTMVELADVKNKTAIYNPACNSGDFLTEAAKKAEVYAFGEEQNLENYNICITNLWLHDVNNLRISSNHSENIRMIDLAIANPPFSTGHAKTQNVNRIPHRSLYLGFLERMIDSLNNEGKLVTILPHGFLFKKSRADYIMRSRLVDKRYIDTIISLPEKLFNTTKIPVIILFIDKSQRRDEILFIDASKDYLPGRQVNILTEENQEKIIKTFRDRKEIDGYSRIASLDEIRENDYDLSVKKYIQSHKEIGSINKDEIEDRINSLANERKYIENQISNLISKLNKKKE